MSNKHDNEQSSCCSSQQKETPQKSCCGGAPETQNSVGGCCAPQTRIDWLLWGSLIIVALSYVLYLTGIAKGVPYLDHFTHGAFELMNKMWWGLALGIAFVGVLHRVPREFVMATLGKGGGLNGILRATAGGLLLDLCNHGILLIGLQLYRRGASLGQVMAFLIASPWNSLSLTLVLFALIGVKWTLAFIVLSGVIAIVSGLIFEKLVAGGVLPPNPNTTDLPDDFAFWQEAKKRLKKTSFNGQYWRELLHGGLMESRMILRWIFFGVVIASLLRTFLTPDMFSDFFGPTLMGLGITLIAATIIEVCSEGSSPIAADILNRAGAPGNAFTFLMTGAATDYTEIMGLKETTASWKIALFLPLVTVPQVLVVGYILNAFGG